MPSYPPVTVRDGGTFAYAAGTAAATVDIPSQARLETVSVLVGSGQAATVTIGGGATITVPASSGFTENISGEAKNQDVVIGGTLASYYVSYVVG